FLSAGQPQTPPGKGSKVPSSLLFCLGGHQVFKSMRPTKVLGCNSWTLPFPIPAGYQGPAGLHSARSRAGPAGQSAGCGVPAARPTGHRPDLDHHRGPARGPGPRCCRP
ncbi:unnamed protein product, partial [Rangifer tarandus platyrhynchus]